MQIILDKKKSFSSGSVRLFPSLKRDLNVKLGTYINITLPFFFMKNI